MQSVNAAFTAESRDRDRRIAENVQASWKRDFASTFRIFTIGVSAIGGDDYIGGPAGVQSAWNKYFYFNETPYVTSLDYERELDMPLGGVAQSQADVSLDNTSGRFTPRYMGGNSELFTAVLPNRPVIINSGFEIGGIPQTIPQFVGVTDRSPKVDMRRKTAEVHAVDFLGILGKKYVDNTTMFTSQRSDVVIENILNNLGFSTAQYELDTGINIIRFGLFETGTKFLDIIDDIVAAENGHFYQDEEGRLRFENRQHWDSAPHTAISQTIFTADVLEAESPDTDHLINIVEIKGSPREVTSTQLVWEGAGYAGAGVIQLNPGVDTEVWANFNDPIFSLDTPVPDTDDPGQTSAFIANEAQDGTGNDATSSIYLKSIDKFAQAAKMTFHSNASVVVYLIELNLYGKPARKTGDIYYRAQDDSSVTAYDEHPFKIENDYIQELDWAKGLGQNLLNTFSAPENLQTIVIRAKPQIQMGDLVSWQGRYWTVYGIKSQINTSVGFVQELKLLQRRVVKYFRIGISTIGSSDQIAP